MAGNSSLPGDTEETEAQRLATARGYLAKVREELARREAALSKIETDIAQVQFELKQYENNSRQPMGQAARLIANEVMRKGIKQRLLKLEDELAEAKSAVTRALERRQITEVEVAALEEKVNENIKI